MPVREENILPLAGVIGTVAAWVGLLVASGRPVGSDRAIGFILTRIEQVPAMILAKRVRE